MTSWRSLWIWLFRSHQWTEFTDGFNVHHTMSYHVRGLNYRIASSSTIICVSPYYSLILAPFHFQFLAWFHQNPCRSVEEQCKKIRKDKRGHSLLIKHFTPHKHTPYFLCEETSPTLHLLYLWTIGQQYEFKWRLSSDSGRMQVLNYYMEEAVQAPLTLDLHYTNRHLGWWVWLCEGGSRTTVGG